MARFRILTLATVFMAAGLTMTGDAQAQCTESNPLMLCPLAVCQALQVTVEVVCKAPPAPTKCRLVSGCAALRAMRQRWANCYEARNAINLTCFGGGDLGHQTQVWQVLKVIRDCDLKIALPEPEGCADPCP